jgi:hypothetical protein
MLRLPKDLALLERFACAFTRPTYDRFVFLCLSAIVTMGRRSVCRLLAAAPKLRSGHPASYHRFFSAAHWSLWTLGRVLAAMVLELIPPDQPVVMEVDDTVNQHRGRKVYGKGWHRDAVRSSHGRQTFVLGHRWVVLAVDVKLPLCKRPWALPVLVSLYRPPAKQRVNPEEQVRAYKDRCKANAAEQSGEQSAEQMPDCRLPLLRKRNKAGKLTARHKTPCLLARQMLAAFLHSLPRAPVHCRGRLGIRQSRSGLVLLSPSPAHHAGRPFPTRCGIVCPTQSQTPRSSWPPGPQGQATAQPAGGAEAGI